MLAAMRAFGIFLLCLMVLVQSAGAGHVDEPPCPMMQGMDGHADGDSGSVDASAGDDCCNDDAIFAKTGQSCKAGQECPTGNSSLLTPVFAVAPSLFVSAPIPFSALLPPRFTLAHIWRPPALA